MTKKKKNLVSSVTKRKENLLGIQIEGSAAVTCGGAKIGMIQQVGSLSTSCTLGEDDTDLESLHSNNGGCCSKQDADQVFVEIPDPNAAKVLDEMPSNIELQNLKDKDGQGEPQPKAPWVNLFRDNRSPSSGLKLLEVESKDEDEVVLEPEDLDDVETAWGFCLVGYFAAKFPGRMALIKICDAWHVKYQYYVHSSGWLVFKFECANDRDTVLNGGPYFVFGRPLLLKMMPPYFEFGDEEISILPAWIQLPGLPLECWNVSALSKIASKVGKPVTTDRLTSTKERLSFARILVEVDAAKDMARSVQIRLPNGRMREQPVIFEFEPKFCANCKIFGHSTRNCGQSNPTRNNAGQQHASVFKRVPAGAKQKNTQPQPSRDSTEQLNLDSGSQDSAQQLNLDSGSRDSAQQLNLDSGSRDGAQQLNLDRGKNVATDVQHLPDTAHDGSGPPLASELPFTEVVKKHRKSEARPNEIQQPETGMSQRDKTQETDNRAKLKGKSIMQQGASKNVSKRKGPALILP